MVGSEDTGMGVGDAISMPGTRDPLGPEAALTRTKPLPSRGAFTQIKKDFNFCFISTELF